MIIGSGSTFFNEKIYLSEGYNITSQKHSDRIIVIPTNQNSTDIFKLNNEVLTRDFKYEFGALIPTYQNMAELFIYSVENEFGYKYDESTKIFSEYRRLRTISKGVGNFIHTKGVLINGGLVPKNLKVEDDHSEVTDYTFDFVFNEKLPVPITIFELPPRAFHCIVQINNAIIIIGGMDESKKAVGIDHVYLDYFDKKGAKTIKTNGYNNRNVLLHTCECNIKNNILLSL